MATVTFKEISMKRNVKVECLACGKTLRRTVREFQTINPFNKGSGGLPKTAEQIRSELPEQIVKAADKLKKRTLCKDCKDRGHYISWKGEHIQPCAEEKPA